MTRAAALLALAAALACGRRGDDRPSRSAEVARDAAPARPAPLASDVDRTLDNGLRLVLHPVPGSGAVALVLLFTIGADHDPPGQSGMAHLLEHLLVTAAAGSSPARPVEEWIRRYPAGWNAQTGSDFTVIAAVFAPDRIDAELADVAARMTDLRIHPDDLARERPRLLAEVDNMFSWTALGAPNRARERARPTAHGGRKGGLPAEVGAITLEQAEARRAAHYGATSAIVVLAGELDERAPELAAGRLGAVPRGRPAPPPPAAGKPVAGIDRFDPTGADPTLGCIAYRAPLPGDPLHPPFLVATGLLMRAAHQTREGIQVRFTPLDEPEVLTLCAPGRINDLPERLVDRLDAFTARALAAPVGPADAAFVDRAFGPLLGLMSGPGIDRQNLYGAAFGRARRLQLGLDPEALRARLRAVTDLAPVRTAVFAPARRGAAVAVGE